MVKQRGLTVVFLLFAILPIALVGCGGGGGETSTNNDQSSVDQTETQSDQGSQDETASESADETMNETGDESASDETSSQSGDGASASDDTESDMTSEDAGSTANESSSESIDGPLEVASVQYFPQNRKLVMGGTIALSATLRNTSEEPFNDTVWLRVNENRTVAQEVSLAPGEERTFYYETDPIRVNRPQIIGILNSITTFDVVDPAIDPSIRPGQVPADGRVVGEDAGIVDVGIPGGQVVTSAFEPPKTFNPYSAQETSSTSIIHRLHSYLVEENPMNFDIVPGLAKSWEISPDGTEILFHLRENLKFSDGHPFTAEDVAFTVNDIILNCDIPNNYSDTYFVQGEPIRYEVVDEITVKAILPDVYRPFFNVIKNDPILPKHLLESKVAKLVPGAWQHFSKARCAFNDNRAGLRAAFTGEDLDGTFENITELFSSLSDAIQGRNVTEIKGAMLEATRGLEDLKANISGNSELTAILDDAIAELGMIEGQAQEGVWGIRPGTFSSTWTTAASPEEFAGLGPYTLNRYDVEQQVVLDRNPNYWKVDTNGVQLPYLERMVVLVVKDRNTQVAKFRTGETDVLQLDGTNRPQDWPEILKDAEAKGWEAITGGPLFSTLWVMFNQDVEVRGDPGNPRATAMQAVFRELNFRKAIAYSVNKQKLIDNIYNGLGSPQWSPVAVPSPFYDDSQGDDYDPYAYDPEESKALLESVGLVDVDGDGIRNITDQFLLDHGVTEAEIAEMAPEADRELEFTLSTNQGNEVREQSSEALVTDAKEIGIKINYKPKDFNALVTDLLGSRYDAILLGFTGDVDPHSPNIWKTTGHLHSWRYTAVDNPPEYEARIDELLDLGVATYDFEEAKEYYVEFQRLVRDNLPLVYLVVQRALYVSKKGLANNQNFGANAYLGFNGGRGFDDVLWWRDEARRTEATN